MSKFFAILFLGVFTVAAHAQTTPTPSYQPYGKIGIADLEMKACDFEKDANAEVLIDKGNIFYDQDFNIVADYHKRIKIFNDNGKKEADIHIPYISDARYEYIINLQAQTINLVDGKIEVTKVDKKQIFTKAIDKSRSEIVFTFPNVKPGSVVEYKYTWNTETYYNFPNWFFQARIPVRYSEISTAIPQFFYFKPNLRYYQELAQDVTDIESHSSGTGINATTYNIDKRKRVMANIPSLPDEPYMSSVADNLQSIVFQLASVKPSNGFTQLYSDTWGRVGGRLIDDEDFGRQLNRKLNKEEDIVNKAKALKTDEEKVAYIFNEVKTAMKWNSIDQWYTNDGTYRAWENKTGNSTEINLILYHLLKQADLEVYPMVVSTREHGKVIPYYTSLAQFNKSVVYAPIDSTKSYILDATNKYNSYKEIPADLLNSSGLYVDKKREKYDIIYLRNDNPVKQVVLIDAEIKPGGKLEGTAAITSMGYNRVSAIERYKKDGEKKYIDYLRDDDNNLKVSSLKFDNMEVDSLPLVQNVMFTLDLAGSDENYIYLNPNQFSSLKNNPFLSENRMTDIYFAYLHNYTIMGSYKLPAGYKTNALPKSVTIVMPDNSISFRRFVAEQDGSIVVRFIIDYLKPQYAKAGYPDLHEFFKKMYELLNEQIILKKS